MTANSQPMPVSVEAIDTRLTRSLTTVHRIRWVTTSAIVGVLALAVAVFGWMVIVQREELAASCMFYRSVSTLSVLTRPVPTRENIGLVVTARNAYLGERCGVLPAASANLAHWAQLYGFHLPG